jgi:hypothetical protein
VNESWTDKVIEEAVVGIKPPKGDTGATGATGAKGDTGTPTHITASFTFADFAGISKVIGSVPSGCVINRVLLLIENNVNTGVITIGTTASPSILMAETENMMNSGNNATFIKDLIVVLASDTEFKIFFPVSATSGSGSIYIYYS